MAETLKVALDGPFNFAGTLILMFLIGLIIESAIKAIPQCKCRCENKEQNDTQ